jgi:hypothetical protein
MKLEIHDLGPESGIRCDLEHILALLAPDSLNASWVVSDGYESIETTGLSYGILESLAATGERISGTVLMAIARKTTQIIWGDFTGYLPADTGLGRPWIVLRAFDNSFWEMETSDQKTFRHIEMICEDIRNISIS